MPKFDFLYLLVSFGGGILGAAFGGLNMFILCGLSAIIGTAIFMITGDSSFNDIVTWGPLLGPHVTLAGSAAAAAYAAKHKKLISGRDIATALMGLNSPKTLLIGGCFGVLGALLKFASDCIPEIGGILPMNTIAISIIINGILVRLLFGKTGLLGSIPKNVNRWRLPNEEECWPWHVQPMQLLIIAIGISLPASYIAKMLPNSTGIVFGLTSITLLFFHFGAKIPVTHHIALSAELFVAVTGNIWWGLAFGLLAAFLTEIFACLFLLHGDTHIDPPTFSLLITFTLCPILVVMNVFQLSLFLPIVLAVAFGVGGYFLLVCLRGEE